MRRTQSADTIYSNDIDNQTNEWSNYHYGRLMFDRYTQTPSEWCEIDSPLILECKPSISANNGQHEILTKISGINLKRKSKPKVVQNSYSVANFNNKDTNSITFTSSPSKLNVPVCSSPQHQNESRGNFYPRNCSAGYLPVPVIRESNVIGQLPSNIDLMQQRSLTRNSVEDLNQEIESLVLEGMISTSSEPPEGHRAPIAELFSQVQQRRTVNTQTPLSTEYYCNGHSGSSGSNAVTFGASVNLRSNSTNSGHSLTDEVRIDECRTPSSTEHSQSQSPISPVNITAERPDRRTPVNNEYSKSPEINQFLSREPPDGCEKVKIVNEDEVRKSNISHLMIASCRLQKPSNTGFVLLPSQRSAFLPLTKMDGIDNEQNLIERRFYEINSKSLVNK